MATLHLISISLLVGLYKRHQIYWALTDEYDVTILNIIRTVVCLDDSALTHIHWLKFVVSTDSNVPFSLCFECNYCVVIQSTRKVNMVDITSVRQLGRLVERLMPLLAMNGTLTIEPAATLSQNFDA